MTLFRILLTAKECHNCPSLQLGDKFVLEPHQPNTTNPKSPCNLCLASLLPILQGLCHGANYDLHLPSKEIRCPFPQHYVLFSLELLPLPKATTFTQVIANPQDQDTEYIIEYLNKIPLFQPLPRISKEHIIDYLNIKKFKAGETIIQQGNVGTALYIILRGVVEVVKADGSISNTLAHLKRGECFGEMSLITGEPCSATIRAQTNVSLLSIAREDFETLINEFPSLNLYFTKLLAQRLKNTNTHIQQQLEDGMMGNLEMITLAELTQTIAMNSKTGTLHLIREKENAKIFFDKGHIINAQYGDLTAETAFFQLLRWKSGNFKFNSDPPNITPTIQWDTMGLLMEGLRLLDEEQN